MILFSTSMKRYVLNFFNTNELSEVHRLTDTCMKQLNTCLRDLENNPLITSVTLLGLSFKKLKFFEAHKVDAASASLQQGVHLNIGDNIFSNSPTSSRTSSLWKDLDEDIL